MSCVCVDTADTPKENIVGILYDGEIIGSANPLEPVEEVADFLKIQPTAIVVRLLSLYYPIYSVKHVVHVDLCDIEHLFEEYGFTIEGFKKYSS